ncbi:MAG: SDR family NAD(P)-dependent oxidoreductase [Granulosicoccaceae bacterium]
MTQRSILITGCSSGIGYDAATTLHAQGWQVFATCRQEADCLRLQGEGLRSFVLDYASSESVLEGARRALNETNGRLDALFNNGAYGIPGLVEDLPRNALRAIFETNLFGQFELINALIPSMRENRQGHIINCSSVLGFCALPNRGAYNSTKFAMEGLSDTLRLELHNTNIHTVLIEPGPIGTKIRVNSQPHFEKWIDVENSVNKAHYQTKVIPRLYETDGKKDKFELPSSAVTDVLLKALNSSKPKPRYYVTTPTRFAGVLKRMLSTSLFDQFFVER